jgi:carboxyl-terminal processing protease
MKKCTRIGTLVLLASLLVTGALSLVEDKDRFAISKGLDIFATLFREVNLMYVDEVQPEKMVQDGVKSQEVKVYYKFVGMV